MNRNKFYVDDMETIDPKRVGELHMLILLLLDTSGSMQGTAIRNRNELLKIKNAFLRA